MSDRHEDYAIAGLDAYKLQSPEDAYPSEEPPIGKCSKCGVAPTYLHYLRESWTCLECIVRGGE